MKGFIALALTSLIALGWVVVPEPATLLLAGSALIGIGVLVRRSRPTGKEHV